VNEIGPQGEVLRHGLTYLWPSEVAEQYYCEYKVHLKRVHPEVRVQSPPLELGEVSHAALASQAPPVTAAEVEQSIRTGKKLAICEWVLEGRYRGVRIRGRPDFFAFEGKKALLLLEFKFSGAKGPYRDQQVQAEIYSLLARSMEFTTEQLCFGIVLFPGSGLGRGLGEAAETKAALLHQFNTDGTLHMVHEHCRLGREALLVGKAKTRTLAPQAWWKAFLFRFDPEKAEKDLAWALEYWVSKREPLPVKRLPRKCFFCPLNAAGLCEHALQEPDPSFEVKRSPDGRIFIHR
jgi:hypothetical protein